METTSSFINPNLWTNAWLCVMLGVVVWDSNTECLGEAVERIKPRTANCKVLQIGIIATEPITIWIFTRNIPQ